jgi:hypothetical protein
MIGPDAGGNILFTRNIANEIITWPIVTLEQI